MAALPLRGGRSVCCQAVPQGYGHSEWRGRLLQAGGGSGQLNRTIYSCIPVCQCASRQTPFPFAYLLAGRNFFTPGPGLDTCAWGCFCTRNLTIQDWCGYLSTYGWLGSACYVCCPLQFLLSNPFSNLLPAPEMSGPRLHVSSQLAFSIPLTMPGSTRLSTRRDQQPKQAPSNFSTTVRDPQHANPVHSATLATSPQIWGAANHQPFPAGQRP